MTGEIVTLSHGAGGRQTNRLIREVFESAFHNPLLTGDDAAVLDAPRGKMAMTTDGFVVVPPFYNGGDIGRLSVCGTVNDLSCMGAKPLYLTCSYIIEEGFRMDDLKTIADSMAQTAREAGVSLVAGDTKVVGRGQCGGIFITTAGVGELVAGPTGGALAREGDAVLVTGDIGRHGCAILLARQTLRIEADISSDCAPLWSLVESAFRACPEIHVIRDATRGGVGTVLSEIAAQSAVSIELDETSLPVAEEVSGLCGMLGLEPLFMACEGRMVMTAPEEKAKELLEALRRNPDGKNAAIIGRVTGGHLGRVTVETLIGGKRLLPEPGGELLPRIC